MIRLRVVPLDEGGYLARSPDVPGLIAQADTVGAAVALAQELTRELVDFWNEVGQPLPPALAASADIEHAELAVAVEVPAEVAGG